MVEVQLQDISKSYARKSCPPESGPEIREGEIFGRFWIPGIGQVGPDEADHGT